MDHTWGPLEEQPNSDRKASPNLEELLQILNSQEIPNQTNRRPGGHGRRRGRAALSRRGQKRLERLREEGAQRQAGGGLFGTSSRRKQDNPGIAEGVQEEPDHYEREGEEVVAPERRPRRTEPEGPDPYISTVHIQLRGFNVQQIQQKKTDLTEYLNQNGYSTSDYTFGRTKHGPMDESSRMVYENEDAEHSSHDVPYLDDPHQIPQQPRRDRAPSPPGPPRMESEERVTSTRRRSDRKITTLEFTCQLCGEIVHTNTDRGRSPLVAHALQMHFRDTRYYWCIQCPEKFHTQRRLKTHLENEHNDKNSYSHIHGVNAMFQDTEFYGMMKETFGNDHPYLKQ